jgi:hypothetical protein
MSQLDRRYLLKAVLITVSALKCFLKVMLDSQNTRLTKPGVKQPGTDTQSRMDCTTTILARAIGLIFGLGLLGVSIWGFTVADTISRPMPGPADRAAAFQRQAAPFEFWATWLILFFPVALLGLWILKATLRGSAVHRWLQYARMRMEDRTARRPNTRPAAAQHASSVSGSLLQQSDPLTDMPDDVREAILNRATMTARMLGLVSGSALALLGVAGVVTGVVSGFLPSESVPSVGYYLGAFRLEAAWVAASGLSILFGTAILRSTLAGTREKPGWLFPLRLFMMIVQARTITGTPQPAVRQPKLIEAVSLETSPDTAPSAGENENRR